MIRILIILLLPTLLFSQEIDEKEKKTEKKVEIKWNTNLLFESNGLNKGFLNTFLYGGYISNDMKDKWINLGSEKNIVFSEISNSLSFTYFMDYNIGVSIADRNIINCSFSDDIMKLGLYGNFDYQDQTIDFSNTNIRVDRFQQYKIDYTHNINNINIKSAISYLVGNYHASFIVNNGSIYTAPLGTYIDINYDINANTTNESGFDMFTNNGNGLAFDTDINIDLEKYKVNLYIKDWGHINWKEESMHYNTDSSFVFSGVEIENIFSFNDSVLDQYSNNNYIHESNSSFKSYIPANFGFAIAHQIKDKKYKKEAYIKKQYIESISAGLNIRWQPYQENTGLGQGIKESNYTPLLWTSAIANIKYFNIIPTLSYGGYSEDVNLGIALSAGKNNNFLIGTQHLEDVFSGEKSKAVSLYFQLLKQF